MPTATIRQRRTRVVVIGAVALIAGFVVVFIATGASIANIHTGDTDNLVKGARAASRCVSHGMFVGCGHPAGQPTTAVFPFPLVQYIPAFVLVRLGVSDPHIVSWLARINTVAFLVTIAGIVLAGRRIRHLRDWTPELLIVLFTGPLLFYALAGFGEMLAAALCFAFVVSALSRRPVLMALTLAIACLGKETLAPFLVGLGVVCARDRDDGWLPPRRYLLALVTGAAAGLGLSAAFNVFRYGTPKNLLYFQPQFRTPGQRLPLNFFAELWFAPSGGLLWFWFSAFSVFALLGWIAFRRLRTAPRNAYSWLPPLLTLAVLVAFQVGLALWAYPFGWIAWGPRLTVPVIPALVVAAIATGAPELRALVDRALRPVAAAVVVAVVLVLTTLPQSGAIWAYSKATTALLAPSPGCPGLTGLPAIADGTYYRCVKQIAWRRNPSNLLSPVRIDRKAGRVGQVLLAAAVAALVVIAHRKAVDRGPQAWVRAPLPPSSVARHAIRVRRGDRWGLRSGWAAFGAGLCRPRAARRCLRP
jgi:hypothetical protein